MGYYIETKHPLNKASQIVCQHKGEIVPKPLNFDNIPEDKALIVVVQNGMFDAAGYAFDEREFKSFTQPSDLRPKTFILLDKEIANKLTGYKE